MVFTFVAGGKGGLFGQVPFPIKLATCIIMDLLGMILFGGQIATLLLSFIPLTWLAGLSALIVAPIIYAGLCGFIALMFWGSPAFFPIIMIIKYAPIINAFPLLTLMCLYNGNKTGFKV